jgi:archaellum component FlaF (FlaF/FlaG flagellin family)
LKKSFRTICIIILCTLFGIVLLACNNGQNGAAQAIVAYIQALSKKDTVQISNLSCANWEQNALLEVDSLTAVGSTVENLSCAKTGQDGVDTYVSCTGVLALDYNGEAQQIDLSTRTYIARQEAGEWRMCGYH